MKKKCFFKGKTVIILLFVLTGCADQQQQKASKAKKKQETEQVTSKSVYFRTPVNGQKFTIGDRITLKASLKDTIKAIDSLAFYVNKKPVFTTSGKPYKYIWNSVETQPGKITLSVVSSFNDGTKEKNDITVMLRSDIVPQQYTYNIIHTYPHDKAAFTQGLVYADGILYESTGNYGRSSLRKVELKTGKPIQVYHLPDNVFGEGICLYNDKIIQLTYKARMMFIYDKNTFDLIRKEPAPTHEGWGIAYDGETLIMSDGSEILYFLDKAYFNIVKRLQVYDHKGPVDSINELEFINGKIYANVYRTDDIVIIDPATGKVTGRINMKGLLKASDRHAKIDVLNGIAYNKQNKHFYVTGKNWPKLFEVTFVANK